MAPSLELLKKVSERYTYFYTKEDFTNQFKRVNAISKELIDKNFKSPVIDELNLNIDNKNNINLN